MGLERKKREQGFARNSWLLKTPDGREKGPFGREELLEALAAGHVGRDSTVRMEGEDTWHPIREHPRLRPTTRRSNEESVELDPSKRELATRWQRFGGACVDGGVLAVFWIPVLVTLKPQSVYPLSLTQILGLYLYQQCVFLVLNGWLLARRGQTIGKLAAGTKIVDLDGNLRPFSVVYFLRWLLFSAIFTIPILGTIVALFDAVYIFSVDRRCLHDHIAGTRVVRVH